MKLFLFIWALTVLFSVPVHAQWQARHRLTSAEYQATFNTLTSEGYRLTWVSGYSIADEPRFAAIFEKKSSPEWVAHHGMTSEDYQSKFSTYVSQGFRLVLVNGYTVKGVDYYVAIWDKSPSGQWVARHGLTAGLYQALFKKYADEGYRLKHVSGYSFGNQARYAAIWEKVAANSPEWVARHGLTSAEYQSAFDTYVGQGFRLVLVNGYQVNNVDYYVAIWEKSLSGPWIARHGMTNIEYQDYFDNYYYQGYQLRVVSGYALGQEDRYAAIWENVVMKASDLKIIDDAIDKYMTDNKVPGLSLAITENDRLVFAKGFRLADNMTQRIVTPYSRFRLMSISKTITATAIMTIAERRPDFKLESTVFGPGSLTGDKYGGQLPLVDGKPQWNTNVTLITVQHLLEHVSGWDTDTDEVFNILMTKAPAEAVPEVIARFPPKRAPNVAHKYVNFGFLVLGRLVADFGGSSDYERYVIDNILSRAGVTTMTLAKNGESLPNEVTYYPATGFRVDRFDSFGGWVGTPIDLCRWSVRYDAIEPKDDYLTSKSETVMWTVNDLSLAVRPYAKGWLVQDGWKGHNGAFDGTGSFFTQRPDGKGFAVVMNTKVANDSSSDTLRNLVDAMISKVSAWPTYDLF